MKIGWGVSELWGLKIAISRCIAYATACTTVKAVILYLYNSLALLCECVISFGSFIMFRQQLLRMFPGSETVIGEEYFIILFIENTLKIVLHDL